MLVLPAFVRLHLRQLADVGEVETKDKNLYINHTYDK